MTDPHSNGHQPQLNQPQPAGHHAMQVVGARVQEQRDIIAKLEDQLDYARAMWSTAAEQTQGLAQENSRLMASNDQLKAQVRELGGDPANPVAETSDTDPQPDGAAGN